MLHSLRRRLQQTAEAEERGESFWSTGFSERVRVRIRHAYDGIAERNRFSGYGEIFIRARQTILEQEGVEYLFGDGLPEYWDFESFLRHGPDDLYPSTLEALVRSVHRWDKEEAARRYDVGIAGYANEFLTAVNEVFAQERVAWKFVGGEMIELKSEELHEAVVEPALRLLHDPRFAKVDATYRIVCGNNDDPSLAGRIKGAA